MGQQENFRPIGEIVRPLVDNSADAMTGRMIKGHIGCALDLALDSGFTQGFGELLCAALDVIGVGLPDIDPWTDVRLDAKYWADLAHPLELEAYFVAALRAAEGRVLAPRAQKRIFVALWEAMPAEDRKKFLARVDPEGQFLRGAA